LTTRSTCPAKAWRIDPQFTALAAMLHGDAIAEPGATFAASIAPTSPRRVKLAERRGRIIEQAMSAVSLSRPPSDRA